MKENLNTAPTRTATNEVDVCNREGGGKLTAKELKAIQEAMK